MTTRTASSTKDMPMRMTEQAKHALSHATRKHVARGLAFAIALAVVAVPMAAEAQRKSPLAGAPAIRKRFELRSTRFEIGAGAGSTINQDFYHSFLISLRAGFHLTDWLSIAGFADLAAANIATGFRDQVVGSLADDPGMIPLVREPTTTEASSSMAKINNILGAQLEFTPFTGKYSLAGKLFAAYDFYAFVGGGIMSLSAADATNLASCSSDRALATPGVPTRDELRCSPAGTKPGFNFGVGLHSYFNQWFAFNLELRDFLAQINPSGRDVNADKVANSGDNTWVSTFMVTGNLVFYLPTTASISQ
jgi:outer membrane beta-barrel protein